MFMALKPKALGHPGKLVAVLLFLCTFVSANAQEQSIRYLSKSGMREVARAEAYFFEVTDSTGGKAGTRTRYLMEDSTKINFRTYSDLSGGEHQFGILEGPFTVWHRNGKVESKGAYKANKLEGRFEEWYESGNLMYTCLYLENEVQDTLRGYYDTGELRRLDVYNKGKVVSGKVYNRDGSEAKYVEVSSMAEFPGGESKMLKYLTKKIKYPHGMLHSRQQDGLVIVSFIVSKQGEIKDLELVKRAHPEANIEAMRVVGLMPRWKPAYREGEPQETRYNLPVRFTTR